MEIWMGEVVRLVDLTAEEKVTWGKCPVCNAPHGQRCRQEHGLPPGTHLERLRNAPDRIQSVRNGFVKLRRP